MTKDEFIKQAAISVLPAVVTNYGTDGNHSNKDVIDEVIEIATLLAQRFVFDQK